jgi:hypothetical protein
VRATIVLALFAVFAFGVPASGHAKGFTRVVLVGSDGSWVDVRAMESAIDGLLSRRASVATPRGGHLRLFFVGSGDFPANPGRYYPETRCVALDWPAYEKTCRRIAWALVRLLRPAHALPQFGTRPTVLVRLTHLGTTPNPRTFAALLKGPAELALSRPGHAAPKPRRCYGFAGRWHGPAADERPGRFFLCREGVYAGSRLHPLGPGVWRWFRLNAGPPT